MNYTILAALIGQMFVSSVNRMAGALLGFVITGGVLLWGLKAYSDGIVIVFFGMELSQGMFIAACLVWFAIDVNGLIQAKKHQDAAQQQPPDMA